MQKLKQYHNDEELLSEVLSGDCREALHWRAARLYFRQSGELGASEQKLGAVLALQCRDALGDSVCRFIYFRGEVYKHPRTHALANIAVKLLNEGFSTQTVADALGMSRWGVARWAPSLRSRGRAGHLSPTYNEKVLNEGLAHLGVETLEGMAEAWEYTAERATKRVLALGWALRSLSELSC